jgi:membrane-associated phospholipid phosphatase
VPRPVPLAPVLAWVLTLAPPASAQTPAPEPYRLSWALDGALLGTGTALFVAGRVAQSRVDEPGCAPCDPDDLNALDRQALGLRSDQARLASDFLRDAVVVLAVVGDVVDVARTRNRLQLSETAADMTVLAEVFLINDGVTALVKSAVRRPRPAAYDGGASAEDVDDRDSQSFHSGHASTAFALGTAAAVTFARRHPRGPARWVVAGGYLVLASATAALRVAAGQHFPTDVIAGAAAGTAVGLGVPWLHDVGAHAVPGGVAWRF